MDNNFNNYPNTVGQAVDRLISEISPQEKTTIANMKENELNELHFSLGMYIRTVVSGLEPNKLRQFCKLVILFM